MKSIVVVQSEFGDKGGARATIRALDLAILGPEDRRKRNWTPDLDAVAVAQLAVGDVEEAFRTCIPSPSPPGEDDEEELSERLRDQASMLTKLASAAAGWSEVGHFRTDPPRTRDRP